MERLFRETRTTQVVLCKVRSPDEPGRPGAIEDPPAGVG